MTRRTHHLATPEVHLLGPGQVRVVNGKLTFSRRDAEPVRLDPHQLRVLHCHGRVGASDEAIEILLRHGVHVTWLSAGGGRCRGSLVPVDDQRATLRRHQHATLGNSSHRLQLARWIVRLKIASQQAACRHYQRQGRLAEPVLSAWRDSIGQCLQGAAAGASVEVVRGHEGAATLAWFAILRHLVPPPFVFGQRSIRPPRDEVNALLSLGYTWLLAKTNAAIQAAGLEPTLGALHELRPGRPSLSCDLMEPLRATAVDRWMLRLLARREVKVEESFRRVPDDAGIEAVLLARSVFPSVLISWERSWVRSDFDRSLRSVLAATIRFLRHPAAGLPEPGSTGAGPDHQAGTQVSPDEGFADDS